MKHFYLIGALALLLITSCNPFAAKHNAQKTGKNDPFKNTMVKSEFFTIVADQPAIVEGKKGTVISIPAGSFLLSDGSAATGSIKVELAEAYQTGDMVLSNLTTTSQGKPLESDGMIYLNATTEAGEALTVNPDKPLQIHMPTGKKKAGMKIYKGERADDGSMEWREPQELESYLTEVDITSLNFLPPGFEAAVKLGMPFNGHTVADKALIDSLYFSLSTYDPAHMASPPVNLNEAYYNKQAKIENGSYTKESFTVGGYAFDSADALKKEIDPALIQTIQSGRFQKSFIATHEFETRLQQLFKTCRNDALQLYIDNLDKPLWQVDEMVAKLLGINTEAGKRFMEFAALRQTTVNERADADTLKKYFSEKLKENRNELERLESLSYELTKAHNKVVDSVADEYRKLLWKREKYRMEAYDFKWSSTGWINVDVPIAIDIHNLQKLEVTVPQGKTFDRVETYIVYEDIKSIYHLETNDNQLFYVGGSGDHRMWMVLKKAAKLVAIAYKGDVVSMGVTNYVTGSSESGSIELVPTDSSVVQLVLHQIEKGTFTGSIPKASDATTFNVSGSSDYQEENSIALDLQYQSFFYREQQLQQTKYHDIHLVETLADIAFPCLSGNCDDASVAEGKMLFKANCRACHAINQDGTGPSLAGVTLRRSKSWLYSWTKDWRVLVSAGDLDAILMAESRPAAMNTFPVLTYCDFQSIYRYIDAVSVSAQ